MNLAVPLQINNKGFAREDQLKQSINQSLALLLSTPCFSSVADPNYGFIFNNLRFEIFNETEGVIYNSSNTEHIFEGPNGLYEKKITGTSKSLNTFATELTKTISKYEKRLTDIAVTMTYIREEQKIFITIKGLIAESHEEYQYRTIINVWK